MDNKVLDSPCENCKRLEVELKWAQTYATDSSRAVNGLEAEIAILQSQLEMCENALLDIAENDAAYEKPFKIARECLQKLKGSE